MMNAFSVSVLVGAIEFLNRRSTSSAMVDSISGEEALMVKVPVTPWSAMSSLK